MQYMTLVPAYGRDYKSKKALLEDFNNDRDFVVADLNRSGTYTNKSDLVKSGYTGTVTVRYGNLRKVTTIKVPS